MPATGSSWSGFVLSPAPGWPPSTSAAAEPSTMSSGVEYFMAFHLLSLWDYGGRPPISRREPLLESNHLSHAPDAAAAAEQPAKGRIERTRVEPAASDGFQTID